MSHTKNRMVIVTLLVVAGLILAACATPTAQVIREEVIVEVTKEVEVIKEVEVTKEVQVEVVKEVEVTKEVVTEVEVVQTSRGTCGTVNLLYWQAASTMNSYLSRVRWETLVLVESQCSRYCPTVILPAIGRVPSSSCVIMRAMLRSASFLVPRTVSDFWRRLSLAPRGRSTISSQLVFPRRRMWPFNVCSSFWMTPCHSARSFFASSFA